MDIMEKCTRILHSSKVTRHVPSFFSHTSPPMVSCSYQKPIAGKIFNYKQAIIDFDSDLHLCSFYIPAGQGILGLEITDEESSV